LTETGLPTTRKKAKELGVKRFNTRKPCDRGHISDRYTLNGGCIACHKLKGNENYQENRQSYIDRAIAWAEDNHDKTVAAKRKWRKVNPEKQLAAEAAWRARNPMYGREKCAARWENQSNRTPKWLTKTDFAEMAEIYKLSSTLTRVLGVPFHVDHVIPLCGGKVSGFHMPSNLQILTASENCSKGNKFENGAWLEPPQVAA
jgi:hypothetical protein